MLEGYPMLIGRDARRLKLDTLVRLRWLAITGQTAAVAGVHLGLGFPLPFGWCLALIVASAALNVALSIRHPASYRLSDDAATFLLAFDILQLAALLHLTGGLQNPFAMLFLAPVLISATVLPPERTLALGLLAIGSATLLVLVHRPMPWTPGERIEQPFLYVSGVWTAILLGTAFTGVYAWRVAEEARQLAQALAATEVVLAREQHLSQLDGLAAAAAHELGTPLATIALVVKELGRELPAGSASAEDLALLRQEVDRCRAILGKLASLGQEEDRRFFERMTLSHLVEEIVAPHRHFDTAITADVRGEGPEPACRRNAGLLYGLANIIDNAADFAASSVAIAARWNPAEVRIEIRDDGPGFAPDVLIRAGEPYVTSRPREGRDGDDRGGGGLGLGLFIAKTLIERTGAQLAISNAAPPATGAIARITWPRAAFERDVGRLPAELAPEPLTDESVVPI